MDIRLPPHPPPPSPTRGEGEHEANNNAKIYVAGHSGMVGSALVRVLRERGANNLLLRSRAELDLLDQSRVAQFFEQEKPEYVFFAAGRTGGIYANNTYRADFIYENITIQNHILHQSFLHGVQKLVFFACSCIYPRQCAQPMQEEDILTGTLEATNEPFAIAKLAGLKMCESYNRQYGTNFITVIPTNVFGPGQHYAPLNSLVVPSLIQKFHRAKVNGEDEVVLWGTGRPARDFLYVDDLADASLFLMDRYDGHVLLNVCTGEEWTIGTLAQIIKEVVGFTGNVRYDPSRPDGVLHRLQDPSKLHALGWQHRVGLREGIRLTYQAYLTDWQQGRLRLI
ncbi:MAG: GDP-L-fucose synthase [Magnetococcales bacterium]|nr:GDP-L-fucose synthase [Magnetococcales bacterium]